MSNSHDETDEVSPNSESSPVSSNSPAVSNEGGTCRRDETSISFRHFLQPQSDVVPTRHRIPRGNVDLVDGKAGLPDFVQGHVITESAGSTANHQSQSHFFPSSAEGPVSSSSNSSSQRYNMLNSNSLGRSRSRANGESLEGSQASSSSPTQPVTSLPDFLSDGPMHHTNNSGESSANLCATSADTNAESQLCASSSFNVDLLRQQIDEYRLELIGKNLRISQLENEVSHQRQQILSLESSLSTLRHFEVQRRNPTNALLNGLLPSIPASGNELDASSGRLFQLIASSECLASQLLQELTTLKNIAAVENSEKSSDS